MKNIQEYVENILQPKLQGDGGWIEFVSFENGVLTVIFRGECSKCLILDRCVSWIESEIERDLQKKSVYAQYAKNHIFRMFKGGIEMAHIKVVRRSMRPEEWTDLRFGWLKRHIYSSKWEIKNLMVRDARQISEMEYEYYPEDYHPLNKGDMYFTPDGTAFFKADVDIPKELQGKELWFSLKTAAEICVKVNGKYIGGVDPNRERMLLSPYVDDKQTLHFEMTGYNRSKPDDERNPESLSVRGCRQILRERIYAPLIMRFRILCMILSFCLILQRVIFSMRITETSSTGSSITL